MPWQGSYHSDFISKKETAQTKCLSLCCSCTHSHRTYIASTLCINTTQHIDNNTEGSSPLFNSRCPGKNMLIRPRHTQPQHACSPYSRSNCCWSAMKLQLQPAALHPFNRRRPSIQHSCCCCSHGIAKTTHPCATRARSCMHPCLAQTVTTPPSPQQSTPLLQLLTLPTGMGC
jgi:hypothetical protein